MRNERRNVRKSHRVRGTNLGERSEIAQLEGLDNSYISRMVNLTTLEPDIVEAILDDQLPPNITLFDLAVDPPRL